MSTEKIAGSRPDYHVPALEKGLDILECLATQRVPLTQAQIARALERGPSELFRMLVCLEKRGYVQKDPVSGAYSLTLRLFELSHTHSPFEQLLRAASRPMQELAEAIRESCHLSVLHNDKLLVLAQKEGPERVRLSVEVGGTFSPLHTASGRLLLAFLPPPDLEATLRADAEHGAGSAAEQRRLQERLKRIRACGFEEARGETIQGVYDLSVLVGSPTSSLRAALTVTFLERKSDKADRDTLLVPLRHCAKAIGLSAGLLTSGAR